MQAEFHIETHSYSSVPPSPWVDGEMTIPTWIDLYLFVPKSIFPQYGVKSCYDDRAPALSMTQQYIDVVFDRRGCRVVVMASAYKKRATRDLRSGTPCA